MGTSKISSKQTGDGGFSAPTVFDTLAEAEAHARAQAEQDAALAAMTPYERAAWLANIAGSDPHDVE